MPSGARAAAGVRAYAKSRVAIDAGASDHGRPAGGAVAVFRPNNGSPEVVERAPLKKTRRPPSGVGTRAASPIPAHPVTTGAAELYGVEFGAGK